MYIYTYVQIGGNPIIAKTTSAFIDRIKLANKLNYIDFSVRSN